MQIMFLKPFPEITAILLLVSCSRLLDLEMPKVSTSEPLCEAADCAENTQIKIIFSESMQTLTVEKNTSLLCGTAEVNGLFNWKDEKEMTFTPEKILDPGSSCVFTVGSGAEDKSGNDLTENFILRFKVAGNVLVPEIISITPSQGSISPETGELSVIFNTPVAVEAFRSACTFAPFADHYLVSEMSGKNIRMIFYRNLPQGKKYIFSLENLAAANRKTMAKRTVFFYTGNDFTPPELVSVISGSGIKICSGQTAYGLEKNESIIITMSEAVAKNTLEERTVLSPSAAGHWSWQNEYTACFIPSSYFQNGENYRINISSGVLDLFGHAMQNAFTANFVISGVNSSNLAVTNITDTAGVSLQQNEIIALGSANYSLLLYFSRAVLESTAVNACSIQRVSGTGSYGAGIADFLLTDGSILRIDLYGLSADNVYKLTVRGGTGGVTDADENSMPDDYIFYFQT